MSDSEGDLHFRDVEFKQKYAHVMHISYGGKLLAAIQRDATPSTSAYYITRTQAGRARGISDATLLTWAFCTFDQLGA